MITTKARKSLQDQDKVGMGETFEARIRGALSPFSMSISLLMEKLIKEPTNTITLDFLLNMVKNQKHQLDKILELLIASEDDREELEMLILTDTLKDYEISEREHPNDSKRTKINFHTVNGGNYEIIPPQQIAETNARTNKSIKAMKEFKKKKNTYNESE